MCIVDGKSKLRRMLLAGSPTNASRAPFKVFGLVSAEISFRISSLPAAEKIRRPRRLNYSRDTAT